MTPGRQLSVTKTNSISSFYIIIQLLSRYYAYVICILSSPASNLIADETTHRRLCITRALTIYEADTHSVGTGALFRGRHYYVTFVFCTWQIRFDRLYFWLFQQCDERTSITNIQKIYHELDMKISFLRERQKTPFFFHFQAARYMKFL